MAHTDRVFSGSIPEVYERFLVPLLFEPYAADLADRVAASGATELLETAAGTGALTRALAARLPPTARIVATDLNAPMLEQAQARNPGGGRVRWQQADALALPFADASFDAVACQFGAMFFPDKVHGYGEARRVLRPEGQFFFNVWDRIDANAFAQAVTDALAEMFPDDPPRFLARTPHGHADAQRIRADLEAADFREIAIEVVEAVSRAPSARDAAVAYCQGTPLRAEIEARGASRLEEATHHAAEALARRFGAGPVEGPIRALVVAAAR